MFTLRTYDPDDFETLYEIDQLCYEREIAYSRRELRNYLRFPGAECVVAEAQAGGERKTADQEQDSQEIDCGILHHRASG